MQLVKLRSVPKNLGSRRAASARRGSALVAALMIVVIASTVSMIYLQLSLSKNREGRACVDTKRAFYMAEAGLSEGFYGIVTGKSGSVASPSLPAQFGNGLFFVTSKDEGQGRTSLTSTGLCGAGRATLSIVLERDSESVGALGLFGDRSVTIGAGSRIDSYDSSNGGGPNGGARLGCNGDITVAGSLLGTTEVQGDVHPGPDGTLIQGTGATITGATTPATDRISLPPIVYPSIQGSAGSVLVQPGHPLTISGVDQAYDTLHVTRRSTAKIVGPATLLIDDLIVDSGGKLDLDSSQGPIHLYVRDWFDLAVGSVFNANFQSARDTTLEIGASGVRDRNGDGSPDAPVTLGAAGTFYGTMYAPDSEVDLPASLELFGGVTAQTLAVAPMSHVHFDRALGSSLPGDGSLPRFLGWRVVDMPSLLLVSMRFDVLSELKQAGLTPPFSRDAHYARGAEPNGQNDNGVLHSLLEGLNGHH